MKHQKENFAMQTIRILPAVLAFCAAPLVAIADGHEDAGNRYDLEGIYASEISASAAYLATIAPSDSNKPYDKTIIIDVRTIEEYVGGHPPGAISIPYPWVHNRSNKPVDNENYFSERIAQDPKDFVRAVRQLGLNPNKVEIVTMCRTGFRSVGAANLLADAGFKNVRNMWEGFKGNLKVNTEGEEVDLDGDGVVSTDPYSGDLDGWANFAGLPVSFDLNPDQLKDPTYSDLYFLVAGER
jgi:rhodanese-related sulfurtransferase